MRAARSLLMLVPAFAAITAAASEHTPTRVDLTTEAGVALMKGQWRYSDARVVDVPFRGPDQDGQPLGASVSTLDIAPQAGVAGFDDSAWPVIPPTSLSQRRGNGRVSFNWYRIDLTVPERIGSFDPTGSTVWFETRLDDYAEVWVDGEIGRAYGQTGGSVVSGWNAPIVSSPLAT